MAGNLPARVQIVHISMLAVPAAGLFPLLMLSVDGAVMTALVMRPRVEIRSEPRILTGE